MSRVLTACCMCFAVVTASPFALPTVTMDWDCSSCATCRSLSSDDRPCCLWLTSTRAWIPLTIHVFWFISSGAFWLLRRDRPLDTCGAVRKYVAAAADDLVRCAIVLSASGSPISPTLSRKSTCILRVSSASAGATARRSLRASLIWPR